MRPNETKAEFEERVTARATDMDLVPGTLAWDAVRLDMAIEDAKHTIIAALRNDWQRLVKRAAPFVEPLVDWLTRRLPPP